MLDWFRETAEENGATFHERTAVTDVETTDGTVDAVVTDQGCVHTDDVLVAGNIWAPLVGAMVDVEIPLVPCAHQYAVTQPVDALAGWDHDVEQPWLRHQDAEMYFRQHGGGYGIGNYNHEPLLVDPADVDDPDGAIEEEPVYDFVPGRGSRHDPFEQPSARPFTEEHFEDSWREAVRILPGLEGTEIERGFNGLFSFTPDHMPILGEAPFVDGFWVAAAVWLTQGGAVGRVMADLLETGSVDVDIADAHITRFQPHAGSPTFVGERGRQSYETVYDVHHPRGSFTVQRDLRRSPLYGCQASLDAEFYDFHGWERPRWYGANSDLLETYGVPERSGWEAQHWSPIVGAEHQALRDAVGLVDRSSASHVEITGRGATEFAQRTFTAEMDVPVGAISRAPMLNEDGGVVGVATVARTDADRYSVTTRGGTAGSTQLARLRRRARGDDSVVVADESSATCGVGVWGPNARRLLESVAHASLDANSFPRDSVRETYVGSVPVTALRTSPVGESGWELHAPAEYGGKLWDLLREAGADHDAVPVGDGAWESLRLEAGRRAYGAEVDSERTPYEARFGSAVDRDAEFVGRAALESTDGDRPATELACLTLDDPDAVVFGGAPVLDGSETIGHLTSAGYGYTVGACVGYAYLPAASADPGTAVTVQYENEELAATVREEPLMDRTGDA
jgi:glycine cleavage system aminomethyltransferase T